MTSRTGDNLSATSIDTDRTTHPNRTTQTHRTPQTGRGAPVDRTARPDRTTQLDRTARADRTTRADHTTRPDRTTQADGSAWPDRATHPARTAGPDRAMQADGSAWPDRAVPPDRTARAEPTASPDRTARAEDDDAAESRRLDAVFAALADPTRRAILTRLTHGSASVNELAAPFAMTTQSVSKHLGVLERAGLISRGRHAQWRPCRLETLALDAAVAWIDSCRP